MKPLTSPWALWAPILVSAVLVFIASSISQAVLPFHRTDFRKVPGEPEVMETLNRLGVARGDYLFPRPANRKELASPAFREKYQKGPIGILTVFPKGGNPTARTLLLWFLYCLAVGAFVAFLASLSLSPGADRRTIFILIGLAALGGHVLALWPASIWYGKAWSTTIKSSLDGLVYGILTGGTFAWMWPK